MFVDITGFTPMTQVLMKNGKEGAEILNDLLTAVFTPVIEEIDKNSGFISSFEGDAFTAIFPNLHISNQTNARNISICHTALNIIQLFKETGPQRTKFGEFNLSVKIGLSYGDVDWGIVGSNEHKTWFFRGSAIDGCVRAENKCLSNKIVIHHRLLKQVKDNVVTVHINRDFSQLDQVLSSDNWIDKKKDDHPEHDSLPGELDDKQDSSIFFPEEVLSFTGQGEFRDVVCVFISIREPSSFDEMNHFAENILECTHKFGGYFEGLNLRAKGTNSLIVFGAPISYEDNVQRAIDFVDAVRKDYHDELRAGVTFGTVFAGIKGSLRQAIYGVIGDTVNLSARFMMKADLGNVWVDENISRIIDRQFELIRVRPRKIKGFSERIRYFKLVGRKRIRKVSFFEGDMVGRKKEMEHLIQLLGPLNKGMFGGIVCVYGSPGIGKSRLLYELVQSQNIRTVTLQTDSILRKGLNPFAYFLNDYFEQTDVARFLRNRESNAKLGIPASEKPGYVDSPDNRKAVFTEIYNNLIKTADKVHTKELRRIESIIGSIIGLSWEGSIYEMIDAKDRPTVVQFAIKEFITILSRIEPLILHVEDVQWIDDTSQEVFQILTRQVGDFPFIILASSRYNDDGTKPVLKADEDVQQTEIILDDLQADSAESLIKSSLVLKPDDELVQYVQSRAEGNPFYIEQFCLYLKENNLLIREGEFYRLTDEHVDIPAGVNLIIIARIDRLAEELKETIQIASVLGREFELQVLKELIDLLSKSDSEDLSFPRYKDIRPVVTKGEVERIWSALTELRYIFSHALLRDAVYEMQLKARLRSLHKLAADTIVKVFPDDMEKYAEIAHHYEQAEDWENAWEYCSRAGEYFHESVKYSEASICFQKSLSIIERIHESEHPDIATSLNNLAVLYHEQGNYDKAESLFERALEIRENILGNRHSDFADSLDNLAVLYKDQGLFDKAEPLYERALEIQEDVFGAQHHIVAIHLNSLASLYCAQGHYNKAEPLLLRALKICKKVLGPQHPDLTTILSDLAELYRMQGLYDRAEPLFQKTLEIREIVLGPQHPALARNLNNLAILYSQKGQYDKVELLFKRSLEIRETVLGKQHPDVANCLNNLALHYDNQGHYDKAEPLYKRALKISETVFGKQHPLVARNLNNFAVIYFNRGQYDKAELLLERALEIREKVFGPLHPVVANSLNNLANLYDMQGHYEKAKPMLKRALNIKEKVLGPEHPDFAKNLTDLAINYNKQGLYDKAELLHIRALRILEKVLGLEHPYVEVSLHGLATLFRKQGLYDKAEPLYQRALKINEKVRGLEHPFVAFSLYGLTSLYDTQGYYDKAEPLYQRCIEILKKAAPDHPVLMKVLESYSKLLEETGREDEAKKLRERAITIRDKNAKK